MRSNKQELFALASQTSPNFDREGVLIVKERHDGFFRRSEGCSMRWFRLRGNLLFYLKGPEPWYEPMGVIILGHHKVETQTKDENGHWPFQIVWENGVCYRMATFHEFERTLWLKAIQLAPYDHIHTQMSELKERLDWVRPILDIATYRMQKGIVLDMNEVPLCELALSCDNLLCDSHGRPPSPMVVVYVHYPRGPCVRYDATEVVDTCSNPSFSRTILFRGSDGLTGDAVVRIVVYDVKEPVSHTSVPMGSTSMKLSTIQEAQRLRVALQANENKTVGFVTINGWSLEPSNVGASPSHNTERNSVDIAQKVLLCHRRSQSLPPRLGLKLKFPSYSSLIKENFVNSHQVTYRFHSGLGGDITVHEIMMEAKICYLLPMQLLEIYMSREKELIEELLSVGEINCQWQSRQLQLVRTHVALLKQYCHSQQTMQAAPHCFKPSPRKKDANLEFAPVNLHLQRMWVHNDTLNKTGFHDMVTVGAFTAHTHKANRTGGLIRLVQEVKDINSGRAEMNSNTNKLQLDYDNINAVERHRDHIASEIERILMMVQAKQYDNIATDLEGIRIKIKSMLALWEPSVVESSLSYIGWPKTNSHEDTDQQTMSTIVQMTEQLVVFDTVNSDCDTFDASSSSMSSKETSPTVDHPTFSSSVPDINNQQTELQFHNDYFTCEDRSERTWNHSFRSVRSPTKGKLEGHSYSFESKRHGSLRYDFKSSASLEQVSYKNLVDNVNKTDRTKHRVSSGESLIPRAQIDQATRDSNLLILQSVGKGIEQAFDSVERAVLAIVDKADYTEDDLTQAQTLSELVKARADEVARWLRLSHAATRLRCESPLWAREHAALQTRRDTCFSQALTAVTSGLACWLCSAPGEVVVKLLASGLGPLCGFEGLLSLYSTEKAMWGDMVVAVEDLHTVVFTIAKLGHGGTALPQVTGTRGALNVLLPVSDSLYARFTKKEHMSFTVTAVFFNIGVNEKATLAEALGETIPQQHSNSDNLDRLNKYYHKYTKIFPNDPMEPIRASSRTKPLEEVMENLRIAVHKKVPKNVEVLHLAASATRLMNGIRVTSCKSAKDRTGMAVTLEQCSILASEYHLAEHELKRALSVMRSEGCRRYNTYKNIGVNKYAFTKKQAMALPEDYRPPPGTYGASQT